MSPATDKDWAFRCSACDANWPNNQKEFHQCPRCERITWPTQYTVPDFELLEARKIKKAHEEFRAYYAEREARLVVEEAEAACAEAANRDTDTAAA